MCREVLLELVHVGPPDEAADAAELVWLAVPSNGQRTFLVGIWLRVGHSTRLFHRTRLFQSLSSRYINY